MDKVFLALSSATRRKILAYLSEADMTAGEIALRFEMTKPSISKHLGVLEGAGLLKREKKGQHVHYSLVRDNLVTTIHNFLANFCPVTNPLKRESRRKARERRGER